MTVVAVAALCSFVYFVSVVMSLLVKPKHRGTKHTEDASSRQDLIVEPNQTRDMSFDAEVTRCPSLSLFR